MKNLNRSNKTLKVASTVFACAMALTAGCALASCSDDSSEKPLIGIMQYGTHESLNNCYTGIVKGLNEAGISEDNYTIEYVNDNFDATVAASHASSLVNKGAKAIVAIATPSAMAAANASAGDVPVIYCAVTDGSVMDSYKNVCGSSDRPNFEKQLEVVTGFMGKSDINIGVVSYTGESSDAVQIEELKAAAAAYDGMEVTVNYISEITTITTVVESMITTDGVDCFVNLLDNTVVGQLDNIFSVTDSHNIPVFGSEVEQVVNGCVASASIDYIEIGRIAGEMAAQVVKGEAETSSLGCKVISNPTLYYNPASVTKFALTVPALSGLISTDDYTK